MTHQLTEDQIRRAEDAHQDQLAEQSYAEFVAMTPAERAAIPAMDWGVLGWPKFDHCDKRKHYAFGAAANGAHVTWDVTPYHEVGTCPNAGETVDGAWNACAPTYPPDDF